MNVTPSKIRINDPNYSKRTSYLTNNTNTFNIYCGTAPSKDLKESSIKNSSKKNLQISEIDINVTDKKQDSFLRTSQNSNSQNNSYFKDAKLEILMEALDFKEYGDIFLKNKVKFDDLFILTKEDLNELKIPLGPRNRILKFVEEFRIFNNNKENFTEKQVQRFFEMKNFTNFLAHSEINTDDNIHSFGNHQRQNSSENVTQSTFGNNQGNNEIPHDNKFQIGSPNFGLFPQKTPTPYFNLITQNDTMNNKKSELKTNNTKKSLINAYKEMNLENNENRNLKDLMLLSSKNLSPQNSDKIYKKLEKNCYKNYKELQIERKMKESQKSFNKVKRNSDKIRNNSPKCENSSSKSFSFKTNKKKLRTIDLDMNNDSCEITDRKSHTPRNRPTSKGDIKKYGGNLLSNYIFSKSNADLFNKSPTTRSKLTTSDNLPKSPHNLGKDFMSASLTKETKLTNYLKANRHLLSKEFNNIEEKVDF
jgi:hypothetical protein